MDSPNSDQHSGAALKRKRSPVPGAAEEGGRKSGGNIAQINYLVRGKGERLRLVEGDSETFADVLGMIDDYEGVLQRHESLAANLGAKLVGPLLLKSFEKLFDGPINFTRPGFGHEELPVSWLDIVTFARTSPADFVLSDSSPGIKTCKFWIKGGQVEISEDDYRLIMSGGPERMIPTQPIPEDEAAELGTLNILENRLAMLIKKADAVASKARQLNYHLKGRKTAIMLRKSGVPAAAVDEARHFPPQPFSAVNARPPNGEAANLQRQLLEQFLAQERQERRSSIYHHPSKASRVSESNFATSDGRESQHTRGISHPPTSCEDGTEVQYRVLMASRIEKLARGDPIFPPCDRCRRLMFDCTKHLTACQACTKKHAKCSWRDIKEGELEFVPHVLMGASQPGSGYTDAENGDEKVDPSLVEGAEGIGGQAVVHGTQMVVAGTQEKVPNDLALLTQIAAAASGR